MTYWTASPAVMGLNKYELYKGGYLNHEISHFYKLFSENIFQLSWDFISLNFHNLYAILLKNN